MNLNKENTNQIDLKINSLLNFSIQDLTEGIIPQSSLIDSDKMNTTNSSFYNSINELYQRIRTLELINEYIKSHVINELSNKTKQIKDTIKEIESLQSTNNNMTYEQKLSLVSSVDQYNDKNGDILTPAKIYDNQLVLDYQNIFSAKLDSITINRRTILPYKSNSISNLLKNEVYRSMYVLKDYQENGIVEEIILQLKTPAIVNHIDIGLHNCYIDSISLTDINNNKKTYSKNKLYDISKNEQLIQEVEVRIKTKNFKQVKYNKSRLDNDFYSSVKRINQNYDSKNNTYSNDSLYLHEDTKEITNKTEIIDPELSIQYILGIDYIRVNFIQTDDKSFYISDNINIKDGTRSIEIIPEHDLGDGTIEYFYIINNQKEYFPNDENQNTRELFFFELNNKPVDDKIFINGTEGEIDQVENGDIVSYRTNDNSHIYVNQKDVIKVGAILRKGDIKNPVLKNIKIVQHLGGEKNE